MAVFDKQTADIVRRLQNARLSLLMTHPFYAVLLMHMKFALDLTCETAYTDGERIAFNPDFMNRLSDSELEFVLMHEVLHAALQHPFRTDNPERLDLYDIACDVVVNSNILYSCAMDLNRITLREFGTAMHRAPDGTEGYELTVEDVYRQLLAAAPTSHPNNANNKKNPDDGDDDDNDGDGDADGDGDGNGNGDGDGDGDGDGNGNGDGDGDGNGDGDGDGDGDGNGNGDGDGNGNGKGKGKGKGGKRNSTGSAEGDLEALIASLKSQNKQRKTAAAKRAQTAAAKAEEHRRQADKPIDDHTFWDGDDHYGTKGEIWMQRLIQTTELISQSEALRVDKGSSSCGDVPLCAERILDAIKNPVLDWRTILNDFVQEELCDYSFSPPDRRLQDCPFFLPDFNEKDEHVKDLLFMIDTSGSMSDEEITACYSEILGAIGQFGGKLGGKLGFFDAVVVEPVPFESEEEFRIIRPQGGGGTSFHIIFDYVNTHMQDEPPVSIIILTDGYAPFPPEAAARNVPVLWIINNKDVDPPWGKVARLIPTS